MNESLGLIGRKLGTTQFFTEDGTVVRATALKVGPCTVVGKRTPERDGYSALVLGLGTQVARKVSKPLAGHFKKLDVAPAVVVREFRLPEDEVAKYEIGQSLALDTVFREGQFVDLSARSKGRGFAGVIKRHGFSGAGTMTHGTHEYKRHGGSIGMNMTPGRTLANQKMAGHYGDERITIMSVRIAKLLPEDGVMLVRGSVPGGKGGLVQVRLAVKKRKQNAKVAA
ncbi:MAG: 50S ribosomal protein L3 [Polyangiales bacterium]